MDECLLELELMRQLEEEKPRPEADEAKEEIGAFMDPLASLFQSLDEYLLAMEEEAVMTDETAKL